MYPDMDFCINVSVLFSSEDLGSMSTHFPYLPIYVRYEHLSSLFTYLSLGDDYESCGEVTKGYIKKYVEIKLIFAQDILIHSLFILGFLVSICYSAKLFKLAHIFMAKLI